MHDIDLSLFWLRKLSQWICACVLFIASLPAGAQAQAPKKEYIYLNGKLMAIEVEGPPMISEVASSTITSAEATITWITDEASDSQVDYGTTTSYGSSTSLNAAMVISHSQILSGLASVTIYHYRVKSRDAVGNLAISSDYTFTTSNASAPIISSVSAGSITSSSATISWTTNEASDSQVDYGTTTSYGSSTSLNSSMVTSHSQGLSGLASGTAYHYRVKSRNAAGNLATSTDYTFTTSDTIAPIISSVSAGGITSSSATISWTTNEASDSQVDYGTTTSYGSSTSLNSSMVTSHSQGLSGLASGTAYHYRVKSRDAAGNLATSSDYTFTTVSNSGGPTEPTNFSATAFPSGCIYLGWTVSSSSAGIETYLIERGTAFGNFAYYDQTQSANPGYFDHYVNQGISYIYRIRAVDNNGLTSPYSQKDVATMIIFTDDPLVATQTVIKAQHVNELRQAVNAMRALANLTPFSNWTDPSLAAGIVVKAQHLQELRAKLDEALGVIKGSVGSYTDPVINAGSTIIKANHLNELREAVK